MPRKLTRWQRFSRFLNKPLPGGSALNARFYGMLVCIAGSLLFRQPTRGFIWASIALGVAVALYLRWRGRRPEVEDPGLDH